MKGRIVKFSVGLVLAFAISIGLIVFEKNVSFFNYEAHSETFAGYVSSKSYSSKLDTAKAFLSEELCGSTEEPVYGGYTEEGELSESEIDALGVRDKVSGNILSVSNMTVRYSSNGENKSANAYLVKMDDGKYKYYTTLQSDGEQLTNSYFASVLDGEKYLNCTSTTVLTFRMINDSSTVESTYRQTIKIDDDKALFEQELPGLISDIYFVEEKNDLVAYIKHPTKDDGKFHSLDEINRGLSSSGYYYYIKLMRGGESVDAETLDTIEDLTDFIFAMTIDASYFEKTSFGFSMPDSKYKEVCKQLAGESAYKEMEEAFETYHVYFKSDYYVTDGRLSANKTVLTMSDGEDVFALNITTNYSNFGTTEVKHPTEGEN
ncbi:MAG: hypothetical protein ACI4MQ_03130 [Candidatus Coproplasma sp.]